MTTYRNIHGRAIQPLATNPTEPVAEGQIWYNTTNDTFKSVLAAEAFSSSAPLATKREGGGAFGTQTTAIICGGETPSVSGATEEYNGIGFSAGGTMNTARYRLQGTAGTATAGIVFGGVEPSVSNKTETYNGTAWTTSPYTLNTARWCAGAGTQTSALAFGGGPGYKNESEEFDGEGWTATPTLNTSRNSLSGAGANAEDCLAFGGETSSPPAVATNATESWNGSSWTAVNNLNTARYGGYGAGTKSAAILIGGLVGPGTLQSATETWDGTNWTTSPVSLATARSRLSVAGSSTAAIAMAGQTPSITTATEEYNAGINVITAGAWAAGGNLSTARTAIRGAGIQTAAWGVGGETGPGPTTNATENYDGTSWTGGGNFPTTTRNSFTYGTQTAGLSAGGNSGPGQTPYNTASAEYDGSTWTASPGSMSPGKGFGGSSGVQTSALATGGDGPPNPSNPFAQIGVQSYNGASWSTETNYPTNIYGATGAGVSETAAVVWGGTAPYPGTPNPNTSDYNGSAWTVVAKSIANVGASNQRDVQGTNQSPSALCGSMGGNSGAVGFYQWNDTAWSTLPNMGTGGDRGGAGTLTGAIAFGGYHPGTPRLAATEEFTPESTVLNVKTLTQS